MHIPKTESGLSKQLLSNFQADNSCNCKQVETKQKNGVAYKKRCADQKAMNNLFLTFFTFLTVIYMLLRLKLVLRNLCGTVGKLYTSGKTSLTC